MLKEKKEHEIEFVQVFRGLAAISVMLYHFRFYLEPCPIPNASLIEKIFMPAGAMGVDLFFLISGFVMFTATANIKRPGYVKDFFIKRFARVFPPYFMATLIAVITIFIFKFDIYNYDHIFNSTCIRNTTPVEYTPYFLKLIKSLLFIPVGGPEPIIGTQTLSVGWTLNYEMYFYLILGISLLFGSLRYLILTLFLGITLIAIPLAIGFPVSFSPYQSYGFVYQYLKLATNSIIWFFAIGLLIGYIQSKVQIKSSLICRSLIILSVLFLIWQYAFQFRTDHGVTMWGVSLIPLMTVFAITSKNANLHYPITLKKLGDISFSIYLLHLVVSSCIDVAGIVNSGVAKFILSCIVSLAISLIFYYYIEKRLSGSIRRNLLNFIHS